MGEMGAEYGGGADPREAVLGEIVHDRGSGPDAGWFIVGADGYFDVDNACWCQNQEGDAPWTMEFFDLLGTVQDLIAESSALAVRYAQAQSSTPVETAATHPAAAQERETVGGGE